MVDTDHVEIEHKPYNCDWDSAPIGSKHCHYEEIVVVVNAQNQVVDGTGIRQSLDNAAISFDDGKTWQGNPARSDTVAAKVHVGWQRAEDKADKLRPPRNVPCLCRGLLAVLSGCE
jgi:hypothetical protein